MAGTGLALFNEAMPALPAEASKFFEENTNVVANRVSVPSLSYEGKQWWVTLGGEKTLLTRMEDGERVPVAIMKVVVLDYNKRRGRAYYPGAYDPAKIAMPTCWSHDGLTPDADVKEKQNDKCETCPLAAKGSKVTEQNKAISACSQHRMLAVVPAFDLSFQPLRLKIAITSDWDGQSPDNEAAGWYAFRNYMDMLNAKQVPHSAKLVTKIKFDDTAFPKLIFSPDRWLTPEEAMQIIPVVQSPVVQSLIDGTYTPNGVDGTRKADPGETTQQVRHKAEEPIGPSPEEVAAQKAAADKAARKAAAKAAAEEAARKAAELAKAAEDDGDEDGQLILPGTASPAADAAKPVTAAAKPPGAAGAKANGSKPAAPAATTAAPSDVAALLKDWGKAAG